MAEACKSANIVKDEAVQWKRVGDVTLEVKFNLSVIDCFCLSVIDLNEL